MKKLLFLGLPLIVMFLVSSCEPSGVIVTERPVAPVYARPVAPGSSYVWIDGEWISRGGRYEWRQGYWAHPSRRAWVGGSWQHRGNGWYWKRGHWR